MTPDGRFLYVANGFDDNVSAWEIGTSGALTPLPGSPIPTGDNPTGQTITPDGRHLYVTSFEDNTISGDSIANDGSLSSIPGSPFAGGPGTNRANSVFPTADGRRLYVAHRASSNIDGFDIASSGALTLVPGSPFPAGITEPSIFSLAITPNQPPQAALSAKPPKPGQADKVRCHGDDPPRWQPRPLRLGFRGRDDARGRGADAIP